MSFLCRSELKLALKGKFIRNVYGFGVVAMALFATLPAASSCRPQCPTESSAKKRTVPVTSPSPLPVLTLERANVDCAIQPGQRFNQLQLSGLATDGQQLLVADECSGQVYEATPAPSAGTTPCRVHNLAVPPFTVGTLESIEWKNSELVYGTDATNSNERGLGHRVFAAPTLCEATGFEAVVTQGDEVYGIAEHHDERGRYPVFTSSAGKQVATDIRGDWILQEGWSKCRITDASRFPSKKGTLLLGSCKGAQVPWVYYLAYLPALTAGATNAAQSVAELRCTGAPAETDRCYPNLEGLALIGQHVYLVADNNQSDECEENGNRKLDLFRLPVAALPLY